MTLIALHGFLGEASDWSPWTPEDFKVDEIIAWDDRYLHEDLNSWAHAFNQTIKKTTRSPRIVMGYSLGGRKAMHALLQDPELYAGAILISAHPGLATREERAERRRADFNWAKRFQTEPWVEVLNDWEMQPIFNNARHRSRPEELREKAIHDLTAYSLAEQEDLRAQLLDLKKPMHWITGALDKKFTLLADKMRAEPYLTHRPLSDAGHRVPWEKPRQFTEEVKKIIIKVV